MKVITAEQFKMEKEQIKSSPANDKNMDQAVLDIIAHVKKDGDKALHQYTEKFDRVALDSLLVPDEAFDNARGAIDPSFINALHNAKDNITDFHRAQKEQSWFTNTSNDIVLGQKVSPLEKVGVYVPGGKAAYPSTALMNIIPAKLAGVPSITVVTPPQADGQVNPHVLFACALAGADRVYKVGGAQAIAALAYGTESMEKVNKIVGPGNAFVARAKKWVYGDVAIDMIAGPSEICIVADDTARASFVAADLLSQAEHDEKASSICVTTSGMIADAVQMEIEKQTEKLDRKEIIGQSLAQNGRIVLVDSLQDAFELVNWIAPEHLQLMVENPMERMHDVKNAGAIFLGNYSPEPLGDYFAGPNHTLPTNGTAAFSSPLGVYDFMKKSSIIHYSKQALSVASDQIITLAETEGLTAHANSIKIRKDDDHA